ncbi:MAG: hypothetical protein ACK5CO_05940 [Bacteroidota bacterium]
MNGRDFEGELNVCLERGEGFGDLPVKETKNIFFSSSSVVDGCVNFLLFLMGLCPKPQSLFAHDGLFFKGIRELASLGSLDARSNQKNQEIPEAISCADQKTKAKKCPRLPLFFTPLSSFAGGNFGGG